MSKDNNKKKLMQPTKNLTKKERKDPSYKLPEEMESEIRDCFNFYDNEKSGYIQRQQMRSILGNFGFINKNVKDIECEIKDDVDENKNNFNLNDVVAIISKKWFHSKGRDEEIDELYELFDRKDKQSVGLNEIKAVFAQYLDIQISDPDILEFIQDADLDGDGMLNKMEFATKLGYF